MATVYKKITTTELKNKQIQQASSSDKTQVFNILNAFVNLFKDKHLS